MPACIHLGVSHRSDETFSGHEKALITPIAAGSIRVRQSGVLGLSVVLLPEPCLGVGFTERSRKVPVVAGAVPVGLGEAAVVGPDPGMGDQLAGVKDRAVKSKDSRPFIRPPVVRAF